VALDLKSGQKKWMTPIAPIAQRQSGQTAALTVIPGVVFSGVRTACCAPFARRTASRSGSSTRFAIS